MRNAEGSWRRLEAVGEAQGKCECPMAAARFEDTHRGRSVPKRQRAGALQDLAEKGKPWRRLAEEGENPVHLLGQHIEAAFGP